MSDALFQVDSGRVAKSERLFHVNSNRALFHVAMNFALFHTAKIGLRVVTPRSPAKLPAEKTIVSQRSAGSTGTCGYFSYPYTWKSSKHPHPYIRKLNQKLVQGVRGGCAHIRIGWTKSHRKYPHYPRSVDRQGFFLRGVATRLPASYPQDYPQPLVYWRGWLGYLGVALSRGARV